MPLPPPRQSPQKLDPCDLPNIPYVRWYEIGDVMLWSNQEWVCIRVNKCSSHFLELGALNIEFFDRWGNVVKFSRGSSKIMTFGSFYDERPGQNTIIRRMTLDDMKNFRKAGSPTARGNTSTGENTETNMTKVTKTVSYAGLGDYTLRMRKSRIDLKEFCEKARDKYPGGGNVFFTGYWEAAGRKIAKQEGKPAPPAPPQATPAKNKKKTKAGPPSRPAATPEPAAAPEPSETHQTA